MMNYSAWNRRGPTRPFGLPPWQVVLALVLALALGVAIAVVATGVFLIAFPIALLAALAYRLFGAHRRRGRGRFGGRRDGGGVIEGDYEVIDGSRPSPSHRDGNRTSH